MLPCTMLIDLVFILSLHLLALKGVKAYCSPPDENADLQFTKELQTLAIGCKSKYTKLHCCSTGYTSLIWEQYDATISQWVLWSQYAESIQRRMESPKNQTFVIESYSQGRDEGKYRCVVTDDRSGRTINNTVELQTASCFEYKDKPKILLPSHIYRQQLKGYNISIPCKGLMGMCDQNDRRMKRKCRRYRVTWYRKMTNSTSGEVRFHPINITNSSRVYQMQERSEEWNDPMKTFMSRTLYIHDVREEDYGVYECQLSNLNGKTTINITLSQGFEGETRELVKVQHKSNWKELVITVAVVLALVALVTSLSYYYRFEIKVSLRNSFVKRPRDGLQYDVFLLYNDDSETDSQFVRTVIYPYLRDHCRYSVYRAEMDFPLPSVRAECYVHAVDMCRAVILVTSPDMISHEWCEFAFHYAITRAKRDMVFLAYRPIPSDFWNDHQRALKAANRMGKQVRWPKKETSRKLNRFWAQLQSYMPVPSSGSGSYHCSITSCFKLLPVFWQKTTNSTSKESTQQVNPISQNTSKLNTISQNTSKLNMSLQTV